MQRRPFRPHPALLAVTGLFLLTSCGGGGGSIGGSTAVTTGPPATTGAATSKPATTAKPATTTKPGTSAPASTAATTTTIAGADVLADLELGQKGLTAVLVGKRWDASAAVEVTNRSADYITSVMWTAVVKAADGTELKKAQGLLGAVPPRATTWITPDFLIPADTAQPTSFDLTLTNANRGPTMKAASGELPLAEATVDVVSAKAYLDLNGTMHLEGLLRSRSDARLTTVAYECAAYRGSQLLGGAFGYVNEIVPHGDAGFDTTSALVNMDPLPTDIRCVATPVNLSTYEPGIAGSGLAVTSGLSYNPAGHVQGVHDTLVGLVVQNPKDQTAFQVEIEADLYDASGTYIHTTHADPFYILPGQTFYTGIWAQPATDSAAPATVRTRVFVRYWGDASKAKRSGEPIDLTALRFDITGAHYELVYGTGEIKGSVTNRSTTDLPNATMACTLLKGGAPVAGNSWSIGAALPVGVAVPFDILTGFGASISHDSVRCNAYLGAVSPQP